MIRNFFTNKKLMMYIIISFITLFVDMVITISMHNIIEDIMLTNSIGVISGFLVQYILNTKLVFQTQFNYKSFQIYLLTFLLGMILANLILSISYELFQFSFLISKCFSIVIPFFIMYYLRTMFLNQVFKEY